MGLFNKIFGSASDKTNERIHEQSKIKQSIFDFFVIDLRNIPDENFDKIETTINTVGETVQVFRKRLSYKECNIFDTIEINLIGETGKNIIFKSSDAYRINIKYVKTLINELYLLYGSDMDNKGQFTESDLEDYNDAEYNMLFGRMWSEYPKYKYPVMIRRDNEEISLTLWSANGELNPLL